MESKNESYFALYKNANTLDDLNDCIRVICKDFSFSQFSIVELFKFKKKIKIESYSTYPKKWVKKYVENGYYVDDPVCVVPCKYRLPFHWDVHFFKNLTKNQQKIFKEAKEFGIISGTTIPLIQSDEFYQSYLTILNQNLVKNWSLLSKLFMVGNMYFIEKRRIESVEESYLIKI